MSDVAREIRSQSSAGPHSTLSPGLSKNYVDPPQYDDFLNSVFESRKHQAYRRFDRQEKRCKFMADKFEKTFTSTFVDLDKRIAEDAEKRTKEYSKTLDARIQKRQSAAKETKEF